MGPVKAESDREDSEKWGQENTKKLSIPVKVETALPHLRYTLPSKDLK
jgi:hypothetical protein